MVVTNLKREVGRPLRESEMVERFGARKRLREGDAGKEEEEESRWALGGGSIWCAGAGADADDDDVEGGCNCCFCCISEPEMIGRRRGFVDGVFWRWERRPYFLSFFHPVVVVVVCCCSSASVSSENGTSRDKGDSGADMMDERIEDSWTMGG
jgi:hypothetical protein